MSQARDFFYVKNFPKKPLDARKCSLEGAQLNTKRSYDMAFKGDKEAWPRDPERFDFLLSAFLASLC